MYTLTARQSNILQHIIDFINVNGVPPTLREIGQVFEINSTNGVNDHLLALERKGYIRKLNGLSRCIKVIKDPQGKLLSGITKVDNYSSIVEIFGYKIRITKRLNIVEDELYTSDNKCRVNHKNIELLIEEK